VAVLLAAASYCIRHIFSSFFFSSFSSLSLPLFSSRIYNDKTTNKPPAYPPSLFCLLYTYCYTHAHLSRILRSVLCHCHAPPLMYVSLLPRRFGGFCTGSGLLICIYPNNRSCGRVLLILTQGRRGNEKRIVLATDSPSESECARLRKNWTALGITS
jgi:hypothetical protein